MINDEDCGTAAKLAWKSNLPQTVCELYFNYVRVLPRWKRSFPRYISSKILDVLEVAPNSTKIFTESGEYVFLFEEKNTLVSAAAEIVKTGALTVFHNTIMVIHLNVSPPDPHELGANWVARGIETFKDGEWACELRQLHAELATCESEQKKKDEESQQHDLNHVDELKGKFSKFPPVRAETKAWFRRLLRRSG